MYSGTSTLKLTTFSAAKIARKVANLKNAQYKEFDLMAMLLDYERTSLSVGIDPFLVVAQNFHETDYMRSWWSGPSRNNFAGIGVTGEISKEPKLGFVYHALAKVYKKGHVFLNHPDAVKAHIGHLLSYMYRDDEMNALQLSISAFSPRKRFINPAIRGTVLRLQDLNGKWAVPGKTYGQSIAKLANTLAEWSQ